MAQREIADYKSRRCRIQRLRDVKFFYGWIASIDAKIVTVSVSTSIVMEPEDVCVFEAYGDTEVALFTAHFEPGGAPPPGAEDPEPDQRIIRFLIRPPITFKPADQSSRKLAKGLRATVHEPIKGDVVVHDVSESGLGIMCEQQLQVNSEIDLTVTNDGREIGVMGTIRYSRLEPGEKALYRTGIEVRGLGRLDLARWRSFVAEL